MALLMAYGADPTRELASFTICSDSAGEQAQNQRQLINGFTPLHLLARTAGASDSDMMRATCTLLGKCPPGLQRMRRGGWFRGQKHAAIDQQDADGCTALHHAVIAGNTGMVKALTSVNANIE